MEDTSRREAAENAKTRIAVLRRDSTAPAAIGILPRYRGVRIPDDRDSYPGCGPCCRPLCGSDRLRERTFVLEFPDFRRAR